MTPDELSAILERITQRQQTEQDLEMLRRSLRLDDSVVQWVSQDGKFNTNVGQITGGEVHIGDRIFQGTDAEVIKEALRSVLQEKQKVERPRNEKLLLQAVKDEVVARLKQSLHNAVLINLGKEAQPEQVKRPWSSDIKIGDKPSEPIPDNQSIFEVFDQEEIAGKLLILGNPGAGKTTTMLDLAKVLIARAEQDADYPIPVLFNLSNWKDDKQPMREWLVAELKSKYGVRKDIGAKWVSDAKLLPMLDGLDELKSVRQEACVQKINEFLQSDFRPQYLVVCSRREEYRKSSTKLQLNGAIFLQYLDDWQVQDYLLQVGREDFWNILKQDETLLELVRTPLWLSIVVLSEQELMIREWLALPSTQKRLECLLNAYMRRMLKRKISNRYYDKQQPPSPRQTKHWLIFLAKQLERESKTEFAIETMQLYWLLTANSQQFTEIIFGLLVGLLVGVYWIPGCLVLIQNLVQYQGSLSATLIVLLSITITIFWSILGGIICFAFGAEKEIKPVETLSWSWYNLNKKIISFLKLALIFDIFILLLFSLIFIVPSVQSFNIVEIFPYVFVFLVASLYFALDIGLSEGLSEALYSGQEVENKISPNQGIWKSIRNWGASWIIYTLIGTLIGVLIGVFIGAVMNGLLLGLFFGLNTGFKTGLNNGGRACIQHFALRLSLYINGYIPWNYARFLDYATDRLFLQRVGGRYRFIHRLLQEHFAAMPLEK